MGGEVYIVAAELLKATAESRLDRSQSRWPAFDGRELEGAIFRHPFLERDSLGILADHVTLEQGTGAVHTAPGHGQEDYVIGASTASKPTVPVDAAGRFYHAEGAAGRLPDELIGKTVWEANPIVIEILKSRARCWRKRTSSTAIRIAGAATIRRSSAPPSSGSSAWIATTCGSARSNAIRKVKWKPAWGEERISNMIATRPDWCISRQRVWGVPIIVFYCDALPANR